MKKLSRGGVIRYLLYLALVTSVVTSVTLARYATSGSGVGKGLVASFITGTTLSQDISLSEQLGPGEEQTVTFNVTNYDGDQKNNVMLGYDIKVESTGNLPLVFSLTGEKQEGDTDDEMSRLVDGSQFSTTRQATGGRLPPALSEGEKIHTYYLKITWPADQADEAYSYEIDRVTLTISSEQITADMMG